MRAPGRRFAGVLLVLALASLGVLVSYGATWVVALVPVFAGSAAESAPAREIALTGRDLAPLGAAMGWVGLAAIAAPIPSATAKPPTRPTYRDAPMPFPLQQT